jgi:hypothetical protein
LGRRALWLGLFLLGCWPLVLPGLHIFGEHLRDIWTYQNRDAHRFTAMSMLEGSLKYHYSLVSLAGDEQVRNGAGYTNWGYGVPLLQIPFHAIARHLHSVPAVGFFPDRAIFFFYLALTAGSLWVGLDRFLATRERRPCPPRLRRHALSWTAACFILCFGVYPSIAAQFHVYDETIVYFILAQLVAMSAYACLLGSSPPNLGWRAASPQNLGSAASPQNPGSAASPQNLGSAAPIFALAAAGGMGLMIRPTGAIFLAMWTALVWLERPSRRMAIVFVALVAPFVVFWLYTNWVRTGYAWSLGFQNSLPGPEHAGQVRFGSMCVDNVAHTVMFARYIFRALFVVALTSIDAPTFLHQCQFSLERHTPIDSRTEPYLGPVVLAFLVWTLLHLAFRRERRIALYLPHATLALIFAMYVYAGAGMAWRYVGDFLPLVFLAAMQYVRFLPPMASSLLGWPLAAVLSTASYTSYQLHVEPTKTQVENIDPERIRHMREDFESTRSRNADKSLPSKLHCGDSLDWPRFNVGFRKNLMGWERDCSVGDVTEVFLGVPAKADDSYVVRLETSGMVPPSLSAYVNGRIYTAQKVGDRYEAKVQIPRARMTSPTILVSIEWQHKIGPVSGKLIEISIE